MNLVTVNGLFGFGLVGSEHSVRDHLKRNGGYQVPKVSDPTATEGVYDLFRGSTSFEVVAIATNPGTARLFLNSFRSK